MYYSRKLIIFILTIIIGSSHSNNLKAQYSSNGNGGTILHSDDVLQLHSTLDEIIARATTVMYDNPPTWSNYPKPYTRELVRKHRIENIGFESATISNNKKAAAKASNTEILPSSIKFSYTFNKNGDLISYSDESVYLGSKQEIKHYNLRKSYDAAGSLIAWQWIAPPYDTMRDIHVHRESLTTLIQRHYGPYNTRAWIQRDKSGRIIETVYVNEWPKYKKKINYRVESRFEGNKTEYYLKTTEYYSDGKLALETRFKPVVDSASLSKSKVPAAFAVYRYSKDGQTMEKIHLLNSGPLEDSSYWPIGVYKFNLKRGAALEQIDTYRVRFAEKDSVQVLALMQTGQMFVNEPGSQQLTSAIPGRLELIAQENFEYNKKSRISQYTLIQENYPAAIITREYQGKWFVEKGYNYDS